jgi:hypothetical protein
MDVVVRRKVREVTKLKDLEAGECFVWVDEEPDDLDQVKMVTCTMTVPEPLNYVYLSTGRMNGIPPVADEDVMRVRQVQTAIFEEA